jgi:hypothetical protein
MLVMLPVYTSAVGLPFSHAYYGAIRHAITVGFVSVMIMGLSVRLVSGAREGAWRRMVAPLVLVNLGCGVRVVSQGLTDTVPGAFSVIGVSGVLELVAFGWWGVVLVRVMWAQPFNSGAEVYSKDAARQEPRPPRPPFERNLASPWLESDRKMDKEVRNLDLARSEHG